MPSSWAPDSKPPWPEGRWEAPAQEEPPPAKSTISEFPNDPCDAANPGRNQLHPRNPPAMLIFGPLKEAGGMSESANKALIQRWFEEVWNQGTESTIDE